MKYLQMLAFITVLGGLTQSCKKPVEGFISDNIFYRSNPFNANQGIVTYSAPLEVDGSTAPLSVKLLDIRKKSTGESVMDSIIKEREVSTFLGEVTLNDTTVQQLESRITKALKRPMYINPVGGRIEITSASSFIEATTYVIDIEVSNIRGSRVLKNACEVIVQPIANPYTISYRRIRSFNPDGTILSTITDGDPVAYPIDVKYTPSTINKVILKFVDKNNKVFNPKTEMTRWLPSWPTFKEWDPFYPEILTDSTREHQFPKTGIPSFPIVPTLTVVGGVGGAWNDGICYYRILTTATTTGIPYQSATSMQYRADGQYEVTFHLNAIEKK
jgi:hypothetical protein